MISDGAWLGQGKLATAPLKSRLAGNDYLGSKYDIEKPPLSHICKEKTRKLCRC
jgi:hypothetical protein